MTSVNYIMLGIVILIIIIGIIVQGIIRKKVKNLDGFFGVGEKGKDKDDDVYNE